jgi:thiamine kinase-like enzyme
MVGEGNTAQVYDYEPDKVLKLYRKGIPVKICEDEIHITKLVSEKIKVCPRVYQKINYKGRIGGVYEKISGVSLSQMMLKDIRNLQYYSRFMAKYHKEIHQEIDADLPSVHEKLKSDIERVDCLTVQEKEDVYSYLDKLPYGNCLCHFDYHPGNIMIDENKKVKIIDWMTACKGDIAADIAQTEILLTISEMASVNILWRKIIKFVQRFIYATYIEEQMKISNIKQENIDRWKYPLMVARLGCYITHGERRKLKKEIYKYNRLLKHLG